MEPIFLSKQRKRIENILRIERHRKQGSSYCLLFWTEAYWSTFQLHSILSHLCHIRWLWESMRKKRETERKHSIFNIFKMCLKQFFCIFSIKYYDVQRSIAFTTYELVYWNSEHFLFIFSLSSVVSKTFNGSIMLFSISSDGFNSMEWWWGRKICKKKTENICRVKNSSFTK